MSQLESILGQLKKNLAESGVDTTKLRKDESVQTVDPKTASAALKDFLSKNPITAKKGSDDADDPALVVERRKTLSAFVGQSLSNNGVASLPGTIQAPPSGSHGKSAHGGHGSSVAAEKSASPEPAPKTVPFTPDPIPVMQICPSCVTAEAAKKAPKTEEKVATVPKVEPAASAAQPMFSSSTNSSAMPSAPVVMSTAPASSKGAVPNTVSSSNSNNSSSGTGSATASVSSNSSIGSAVPSGAAGMSMSAPQGMSFSAPLTTSETPSAAVSASPPVKSESVAAAKPQSKGGVAGFFANLMPGKKGTSQESEAEASSAFSSAPASSSVSVSKITWFKHIQAIESALLIGDVHFADSLLQLLYETAKSLSAEVNIIARLQSLQAKVLIERKQFDDAESSLKDMIQSLQGTSFAKNICTAYCWRALALCYHRQKKTADAESARKKSIEVAEAALGPTNPETMLFKEPII